MEHGAGVIFPDASRKGYRFDGWYDKDACNKTGCEFSGWFLASDDSICAGQSGGEFIVKEDIVLKAHFEKKEAVKVTITFDAEGGKEVKPIRAAKGGIIRLPKTEKDGIRSGQWRRKYQRQGQ